MGAAPSCHVGVETMSRKFTSADRCDGCSARAKFLIMLPSGGSIQLCGHHTNKSMAALEKQGALILEPDAD